MTEIRWGILGSGYIAGNFANGLRAARGCSLHAVASRRPETARSFAAEQGTHVRAYGEYEALVADPDIDVVYVATPNEYHVEHSLLAIEAGKAVLCEKPMALSHDQAAQIFDAAERRGVFCMEGMWMRCSPALQQAIARIREGQIGEPRLLASQLGFPNVADDDSRLFRAPGGGALLDLGVYLVSLAHAVFGMPAQVLARAIVGPGGVDEQASMLLTYEEDRQAMLTASIRSPLRNDITIHGTHGLMHIDVPVYFPQSFRLTHEHPRRLGGRSAPATGLARMRHSALLQPVIERARALKSGLRSDTVRIVPHGSGLTAEAEEVCRCLRAGLSESPLVGRTDTLGVMQILDTVRHNWTHF